MDGKDLAFAVENVGVECFEMSQEIKVMSYPTKKLEEMVMNKTIVHNGNKVMRWMMSNIMLYRDPNDNIKIDKAKSSEKVDGPVSLVMALGTLLDSERQPTNVIYAF